MSTETIENPLQRLSDEQLEQLGKEFDAIHDEVYDDLGADDAKLHPQRDRVPPPPAGRSRGSC